MAEAEERKEKRAEELKNFIAPPKPKMFRPKKFIVLPGNYGFFYLDRDEIISIQSTKFSGENEDILSKIDIKKGETYYSKSKPGVIAAVLNNEREDVFVTDEEGTE